MLQSYKGVDDMNYTYDPQTMKKIVFDFIYGCAMQDAISQKSFKGKKTWVGQVEDAKMILNEYLSKVLNNKFSLQDEHDKYFLETANSICKVINKSRPQNIETDIFSFGNAQKLINIAVKHIYSFCYHTESLRAGFKFCHCPVDRIMLTKVWDLCRDLFDLGTQQEFFKAWGSEGIVNNTQPILSEFPQRYALYQKAIRFIIGNGNIFPVEFDYIEWKS